MKQTYNLTSQTDNLQFLTYLLSSKQELEKKKRINIYVPQPVIELIDILSENKSRGELIGNLVLKEAKKRIHIPYGMFSGQEITKKDIKKVTSSWEKTI